jgi:hypothetical protein
MIGITSFLQMMWVVIYIKPGVVVMNLAVDISAVVANCRDTISLVCGGA